MPLALIGHVQLATTTTTASASTASARTASANSSATNLPVIGKYPPLSSATRQFHQLISRCFLDPFTTLIFLARDDGRLFIFRQLAAVFSLFFQNSGYLSKHVHGGCGAMPRDAFSAKPVQTVHVNPPAPGRDILKNPKSH